MNNAINDKCLNTVATFFKKSDNAKNMLVYIACGFGIGNDDWLPDLKDSIFNKYGEGHIVVGIIYWDSGSKGFKSSSRSYSRKPFHGMTKWIVYSKVPKMLTD